VTPKSIKYRFAHGALPGAQTHSVNKRTRASDSTYQRVSLHALYARVLEMHGAHVVHTVQTDRELFLKMRVRIETQDAVRGVHFEHSSCREIRFLCNFAKNACIVEIGIISTVKVFAVVSNIKHAISFYTMGLMNMEIRTNGKHRYYITLLRDETNLVRRW
jgi:hypothetical protein